jgi:ssRNA-specific RNase YbeY (16S rRNA maturation enzyme)
VIHGALHPVGYDHEVSRRERLRMERREIAVLRSFGIGIRTHASAREKPGKGQRRKPAPAVR